MGPPRNGLAPDRRANQVRFIRSRVKPFREKDFSSVLQKNMIVSHASRLDRRGVRVVTDVEAGSDGRFGCD
jgi:hypothetical protein